MRVQRVIDAMEAIAPLRLAADWDNVGLIAGSAGDELGAGGVLLAIDMTEEVAAEAVELGVGLVIAYHPPVFKPMRTLTDATREGRAVLTVLRSGASVYSPHTAIDATPGGLADWLLGCCVGDWEVTGSRVALEPGSRRAKGGSRKIVVFVPEADAEGVADAMAEAGAGVIGAYTRCSYRLSGEGAFVGGAGSNPAIGERGVLERVDELRIEMVCDVSRLGAVVGAMVGAHPYEEPAFDVYARADVPDDRVGEGRVCALRDGVTLDGVARRVRDSLGVEAVRVLGEGARTVTRVAVVPGSGASVLRDSGLMGDGAGLVFVTGEMTHHEVLATRAAGVGVVLAGHIRTERGYLPVLRDRLGAELGGGVRITLSERDAWPLRVV